MSTLEQKLEYNFRNKSLLQQALTHSSYANEKKLQSYERLEFLGDSILGMNVAEYLYKNHPNLTEGQLTRKRAILVCEENLVLVANNLSLEKEIKLGGGLQGVDVKPSILADVVESILAAVYLDSGSSETAKNMVQRLVLHDKMPQKINNDYKSALQEKVQKNGVAVVLYTVLKEEGPDHAKTFYVEVSVNDKVLGNGMGKSKKEAEQQAAKVAMQSL